MNDKHSVSVLSTIQSAKVDEHRETTITFNIPQSEIVNALKVLELASNDQQVLKLIVVPENYKVYEL